MIYAIPVFGWILGLIFQISLAIPFYFAWNALAPVYFSRWIYAEWLQLPFWHIVGLFIIIGILKGVLLPSFSSTTTQNNGKKA